MTASYNSKIGSRDKGRVVRKHLAKALVGQSVELLVDAHTIVQGIVTAVMTEAGMPKLVVGGTGYHLNQILTAIPAALAHQLQPQH